jgi:error-prone DNA polymerase
MDVPNSERALNAPLQLHDYNCTRGALINTTQTIRVPVLNIKGLTQRTKDAILAERRRGEFTSLHDFFTRVQPLNEEMERLIQAGAFDLFGKPRTTQYWQFRALLRTPPWNIQNPESRVAPPRQLWLLPPENLELERRLPSVPLDEPERLQCLRWEEELFGYPVSGHPLELYPNIAWDTYCPVNRLDEHIGEQIVTCGLVIEQRLFHQVTGEPMKFITIADWTGIVETELFARTYKSYGLATVRYPVLEITATVEPFENGRGFTLRVLRAAKPRMKTSPNLSRDGVRRR